MIRTALGLASAGLAALALAACVPAATAPAVPAAGLSPAPGTSASPAASVSPAPPSAAPASPGPTAPPTALAINGLWMTGGPGDPEPAGPYMTTLQCPEGGGRPPSAQVPREDRHRAWQVTHTGDDVAVASLYDQGVGPTGPAPHCPERKTAAKGTYKAGVLTLTGTFGQDVAACAGYWNASPWPIPASTSEAIAVELRYDAASGHLRGTRNGQPFWAAPIQDPPPDTTPCPVGPVS